MVGNEVTEGAGPEAGVALKDSIRTLPLTLNKMECQWNVRAENTHGVTCAAGC